MGFTQVDSEVATSSLHDYWVSYEKMKAHGSKRHIIIIVAAVTREDDDSGLSDDLFDGINDECFDLFAAFKVIHTAVHNDVLAGAYPAEEFVQNAPI